MTNGKIILVTGATGKQGGALVRHLLTTDFKVRALTRNVNSESARRLQAQGVEVVQGDQEDKASLERALNGVYGVFSVQNFWEKGVGYAGEIRQARNLIDASVQAGVNHFVQASIADAAAAKGVMHWESKAAIERYIDQIGLPRTFLRAVFFMENFFDPKSGSVLFPMLAGTLHPNTRFHMVAVDDIGAMGAFIFQNPQVYIGQAQDVAGDQLTLAEIRATFEQITGRKTPAYTIPKWISRLMISDMVKQLEWNNKPGWSVDMNTLRAVFPNLTSFAEFLSQHQTKQTAGRITV
ncbi:NmrA/HSCARG family protein [Nibrella saemangeumensis]|uniref:NmrA/HSCARG family protein n=1 Tax=Nibrella saemangeumensis TaxID=1084526 RepID=A0ABP8NSI8_9BACT